MFDALYRAMEMTFPFSSNITFGLSMVCVRCSQQSMKKPSRPAAFRSLPASGRGSSPLPPLPLAWRPPPAWRHFVRISQRIFARALSAALSSVESIPQTRPRENEHAVWLLTEISQVRKSRSLAKSMFWRKIWPKIMSSLSLIRCYGILLARNKEKVYGRKRTRSGNPQGIGEF